MFALYGNDAQWAALISCEQKGDFMIKVANAPCSWGVLEFDIEGDKLEYPQFLAELKDTGYAGTELGDWGFLPSDPQQLKAELQSRDIDLIGAFVPVALVDPSKHQAGIELALKTAKLMHDAGYGHAFIVLADDNGSVPARTKNAGRVTPDMSLTEEQWKVFADGANKVAQAVKDTYKMRTVFHHHCAGYVETPEEIDNLLKFTDPELLGLCLDMGHYRFGGGDPLQLLKDQRDRIWHVHFKDCSADIAVKSRENKWDYFESVGAGVFCELGKGEVDFQAIVTELHRTGYSDWITVEQDVLPGMGAPKECAQRNRDYIKGLGL
jgi:inosose dehydratase